MKEKLSINDVLFLDAELAIKWNDDKQSFVALELLRKKCPCAFCSGEKDVLGNIYKSPQQELGETAFKAVNFEKIGHYAIRIFWADRHADGLYTYEMLRKLGDADGKQT